ncbi:MAG: biotin--[acetyl-CoA-carboxylase] ligase [Euryarchaeota archaeon]|nr:biotin--[acetyl-CoA-carboxylase] ligase [Euryarchaeota archaeon]
MQFRIEHFSEVDSTNDVAKRLAIEGAPEGTVVISEIQKKGRGRKGREWFSPKGGVWMSIILRPKMSPSQAAPLTLIAGLAVAKTLSELYNLKCKLKWPNDVLINEKKVCGVLTEISAGIDRIDYIVAGIGINANIDIDSFPGEFRGVATTIKNELNKEILRDELVEQLLEEFEKLYKIFQKQGFSKLKEEWKKSASTIGRKVRIITDRRTIEGIARDLGENGELFVETQEGIEKIISGDCIHL